MSVKIMKDGRRVLSGIDYTNLKRDAFSLAQGACQICGGSVRWDDCELDHYKDIHGNPILSRGMGGSRRHDSLETCRTTHRWCNHNRVANERK